MHNELKGGAVDGKRKRRDHVPAGGSGRRVTATGIEHELFRVMREVAGSPGTAAIGEVPEQLSLFPDENKHQERMERLVELLLDPTVMEPIRRANATLAGFKVQQEQQVRKQTSKHHKTARRKHRRRPDH